MRRTMPSAISQPPIRRGGLILRISRQSSSLSAACPAGWIGIFEALRAHLFSTAYPAGRGYAVRIDTLICLSATYPAGIHGQSQ